MNLAISSVALGFFSLILIIASVCALDEIRSDIYNLSQKEVVLDGAAFSGLYYDIDSNYMTETLTLRLNNISSDGAGAILSDEPDSSGERGITYTTWTQEPTDFSFDRWGQYYDIYYLGDEYLAKYDDEVTDSMIESGQLVPLLYDWSENSDLMANEQLCLILLDDDDEEIINLTTPLILEEGYQLAMKNLDADVKKVQVELSKDGNPIDNKIIEISDENLNIDDETYYYKKDLGSTKDIVIIAVHLERILRSDNESYVVTDGIFQISDQPISLESATNTNPVDIIITLDNEDRKITVHKNQDQVLVGNLRIKTSDQDIVDAQHPLRYYVYKKYNESGRYELHSSVANLSSPQFAWNSANFPGFYNDIDNDVSTEQLLLNLSNVSPDRATLSDQLDANGLRGLVYTSRAANKSFKFKLWGQYKVIGFLGDPYFAAYDNTGIVNQHTKMANRNYAYLYEKSENANLMTNEQISRVLMDTDAQITISSEAPLRLEEGYQLAISSADVKGNKVQLNLSRNGTDIDTKIIQPSIDNADMGDQTYYYKSNIGDTEDIVQLAVHFKNAFAGSNSSIATVDGIFQISDAPVLLKPDGQFDLMSVRQIDPDALAITMDNKNNQITLSLNKDITLMGEISICVADQDEISDAEPLRYYLYKYIDVEGEAPAIGEAAPEEVQVSEVQEKDAHNQDVPQI
jgi:S-layer protein (TIGR01567 family)